MVSVSSPFAFEKSISATGYSAPKGSLPFWKEHFDKHKIQDGGIQERFGQKYIRFQHPAGLAFEIIEEPNDPRKGWTTEEIGAGESARGFYGTVLSMSLTYVTISTTEGILKVPNSSVLASAVGPFPTPNQKHNPGTPPASPTPAPSPPVAEDDTTFHHQDAERRRVASFR